MVSLFFFATCLLAIADFSNVSHDIDTSSDPKSMRAMKPKGLYRASKAEIFEELAQDLAAADEDSTFMTGINALFGPEEFNVCNYCDFMTLAGMVVDIKNKNMSTKQEENRVASDNENVIVEEVFEVNQELSPSPEVSDLTCEDTEFLLDFPSNRSDEWDAAVFCGHHGVECDYYDSD